MELLFSRVCLFYWPFCNLYKNVYKIEIKCSLNNFLKVNLIVWIHLEWSFLLNAISRATILKVWSRKLRDIFRDSAKVNCFHNKSKTLFVFFYSHSLTSIYWSFPETIACVKTHQIEYQSKYDNPAIFYQHRHYLQKSNIMPLYSFSF